MSKFKRLLALTMALCLIAGIPVVINTPSKADEPATVQKAEIISEDKVRITFSEPVHLNTDGGVNYFTDLRVIDNFTNQDLQYIGDTPLQLRKISGSYSLTEDNGTLIYTNSGIRNFYRAFTSDPAFENCVLTWCIEDSTETKNNGLCEAILDGNNDPVSATKARDWADQCYVEVKDTGAVHLTDVIQLNETQLAMKFDCGGVWNNGTIGYMAIRLIDGMPTVKGFFEGKFADVYGGVTSDNQHLQYDGGTALQWHVNPDYLPAGSPGQMVVNLAESTLGISTISGILDYAKQHGYVAALCFEENALGERGLIDSYGEQASEGWACSGRYLMASNPQSEGCHWDQLYVPITKAEDGYLQVTDVKVLGERGIIAEFNEPVNFKGNYDFIIRLVDDNNNLQMGEAGGTLRPNDYLQFGPYYGATGITNYKNQTNTILGAIDTDYSVIKAYAEAHDLHIALNIGDNASGIGIANNFVVDGIEGATSGKKLATIGTAFGEGLYYTKPFTKVKPITINKAEIIQDNVVNVTFSEAVDFTAHGNGCDIGAAIVDSDNNLVWDNEGTLNITGAGNPLFAGLAKGEDWQVIGGDASKWSFTMNNTSVFGTSNLQDVLKQTEAGGKYEGYKLAFCIQNYGSTPDFNGAFYSCTAVNGINALGGNSPDPHRCFVNMVYSDSAVLEKVTQLDEKNLALKFSCDNVWNNGGAYCAVRLVDNMQDQNLMWDGATPLQWGCSMAYMSGNPAGQMCAAIVDGTLGINTLSAIKAYASEKGYAVAFCIEESGDIIGNNGFIDSYGEKDTTTDDWVCNGKYLKASKRGGVDGLYVPISDDENEYLEIKDVYVLGNNVVAVEFDEAIKLNGKYDMILRVVDDNNNLQTAADETFAGVGIGTGGYLQFGPYYGADSVTNYCGKTNTIIGTFGSDYTTIKNYADAHGLHVAINIGDNGSGIGGNFIVENIEGVESGNKLKAVNTNFGEGVYYTKPFVAHPDSTLTIESIEVLNANSLKVTFSEEVDYSANPTAEAWLRLADANNDMICAKGDGTYTTESQLGAGHQQWGGTLSPTNDKKVFIWSSSNLIPAARTFAENKTELDKVGARFTLCFEQYAFGGLISDFTAKDSVKALLTNGVIGNRSFQTVTGMENVDKISVESITPVSDNQLKITFSDEVVFGKNTNGTEPEFWLRLMANDVSIAIKKADGSFGSENGGASGEYCQWSGTIAPTENKKEYIWTMNSYNTLGLGNLANVKTFMANNAEGLASVGAKLTLCCEQKIPAGAYDIGGYIDNVTTENGLKVLEGNNSGGYRNFTEVTGMEDVRGITVKSAVAIDSRTVKVTFSEPVVNNVYDAKGGFISMRLVDENDNLMFRTKTGGLSIVEAEGQPIQFGGDFKPTDDPSVWFFTTSSSSISYMMDTVKPDGIWAGYKYKFCIEQQLNEAGDNEMGFVDNFTSPDGKHKLEGAVFLWDRCYVPVSIGYSDPYFDTIHMESAKAIDDSTLLVQFSEPIEIIGGPFCAIRLVEPDTNYLGWDGKEAESTPLQFTGYFAYADEKDHSKMYFIMNGSQLFGVKTVQDVINMEGELECYRDVYVPRLCIEKIGYGANSGVVENVIAEGNPNKVLEAYDTFYRLGYLDGAYCDITNDFVPTELVAESVTAINDLQLVVKFNHPIELNKDNAPFMAIRLVDENNGLLWDGEVGASTPMQFTGDWDWHNEEHTEIVWTMHGGNTYGAGNVREVLNFEGELEAFKDAKIAFCIEELPPNIFGNSGHIDNITLKGKPGNHLYANAGGGYDGLYLPIDVKFDLEPLTYSATAINDMQLYIQFSDSVEIVNSPWMSIRYVGGDNTLLWSNGEGTSTPMQFAGTWEWANASHTAIIWTMNGANTCLANTITDVMSYVNALCAYEGCGIKMCIEELASEGFAVHSFDNLLSNIYSADGTRHLAANKNGGYDGSYKNINIAYDTESTLEIIKIVSKTDKTVNLTFNKPVEISDEVAMGLCFVDGNGTVAVGIDARDMKYKGTWKYVNDDKTEIEWTIKDGAGTIADMLGYKGAFSFYKDQGLSLKFYIQEHEGCHGWNKLVEDVTTDEGKVHLLGSLYADQDMFLTSLETEYEIADDTEEKDVETDTEPETVVETKEVEDYTAAYVIGGGVAAIGLAIGLILGLTKKKKN